MSIMCETAWDRSPRMRKMLKLNVMMAVGGLQVADAPGSYRRAQQRGSSLARLVLFGSEVMQQQLPRRTERQLAAWTEPSPGTYGR